MVGQFIGHFSDNDADPLGLRFEVTRLPGFVEPRFQGSIESQGDVVALARPGLDPVPLMASRRFWAEPDSNSTVLVLLDAPKRAIDSGQPLVGWK